MMFMYELGETSCRKTRYWNENENFFEDSYELMEALSDNVITPKFNSYDDLQEWLEENNTDEFSLSLEDIGKLYKLQ